jgi:uncharacterized protein YjiS (DUF1127 family)
MSFGVAPSFPAKETTMARRTVIKKDAARVLTLLTAIRTLMFRARGAIVTYRENRTTRRAFMNTLRLDEKMLDDIGVTREEVEWAASLPLRVNASHALYTIARRRRSGLG